MESNAQGSAITRKHIMIMISSAAGVRMAKAGHENSQAFKEHFKAYRRSLEDQGQESKEEAKLARERWARCANEYTQACKAVLAELHNQNLHEMTGP